MMTSKVYRLLMGMLCLVLWPGVIAAYGDCGIGQVQERLKVAGFDPRSIDGVLGARTRDALRRYQDGTMVRADSRSRPAWCRSPHRRSP
jgi:hypothetical protein